VRVPPLSVSLPHRGERTHNRTLHYYSSTSWCLVPIMRHCPSVVWSDLTGIWVHDLHRLHHAQVLMRYNVAVKHELADDDGVSKGN
jgi:hypothetical protein